MTFQFEEWDDFPIVDPIDRIGSYRVSQSSFKFPHGLIDDWDNYVWVTLYLVDSFESRLDGKIRGKEVQFCNFGLESNWFPSLAS